MSRKLPLDPKLGADANVRLHQLWVDAAIVTRDLQDRVRAGAGSPENVVAAPVGVLYLRTDGGANTTLYVKESGTGNTGWIAK